MIKKIINWYLERVALRNLLKKVQKPLSLLKRYEKTPIVISAIYLVAIPIVLKTYNFIVGKTSIETAAVILTGIVIIFYTYETYQLRKTSEKQLDMQIRSFVIATDVHYDAKNEAGNYLKIKNIGNGPAINISIDDFVLEGGGRVWTLKFEKVPFLARNVEGSVGVKFFDNGVESKYSIFALAHLNLKEPQSLIDLSLNYQDMNMSWNCVKETFSPDKGVIVSFNKA